MRDYRLRCWDDNAPVLEEDALDFPNEDDAVYAALELAANHQRVELWHGDALIAYLARTDQAPAFKAPKVLH